MRRWLLDKNIAWTIAGSDSGGGAGIQADLHTMQDFGVLGCTVITALTAQNSVAVSAIEHTTSDMIQSQLSALQVDLPAQHIKLGMLGNVPVMETVSAFLKQFDGKVICDPVMVSTSGKQLMLPAAKDYYIRHILPHTDLITPNVYEVEAIVGFRMDSMKRVKEAAKILTKINNAAVLLKGAYQDETYFNDYCYDSQTGEAYWVCHSALKNTNTHGTGCSLSAAITACLARGKTLKEAIMLAKSYVHYGILNGQQYGGGPGPVAHFTFPQKDLTYAWLGSPESESSEQFSRVKTRSFLESIDLIV